MVKSISGVGIMKVGATVHSLRIQTHMEGHAVQTMTVASMMALHTPGVREMKKMSGTTVARYLQTTHLKQHHQMQCYNKQ